MARIVVTGAAGFLGSYLTLRLLRKGHDVIGIVRGDNKNEAERIARQRLRMMGAMEELNNLSFIFQDLADFDAEVVAAKIGKNIESVWHCAAMVNIGPKNEKEIYKSNVIGTRNVIRLTKILGANFHHASTAYVAGSYRGIFKESDLDVGQTFRNTYEKTKFEAEQIVRQAFEEGSVSGNIYRLGIVIGDTRTGFTTAFLGYYQCLAAVIHYARQGMPVIRVRGQEDEKLSLVPLDFVVDCLLEISRATQNMTYHLVPPQPKTVGWWLRRSLAVVGLEKIEVVDPSAWYPGNELEKQLNNKLAPFLPYMTGEPVFDTSNLVSACSCAQNFEITPEYARKIVDFAIKQKFGYSIQAGGKT